MSAVTARVTERLPLLLWLTGVWVALWGSVSVANVLGGLGVAVLLLVGLPLPPVESAGVVRPRAVLRFALFFARDLVESSWQVARLVLSPGHRLRQAVVRVPVRGASDQLLTLLANAISLTPGTLTLEVDRPNQTLYVHVIDVGTEPDGVERVRARSCRSNGWRSRRSAPPTAGARSRRTVDDRRRDRLHVGLGLASLLTLVRLVRGPSVPTASWRWTCWCRSSSWASRCWWPPAGRAPSRVLIAVSLLAFVGTVTVARFVERRGS